MQINRLIFKNIKHSATAGHFILVIAALVSGIATGKMMWLGSIGDHWLIRIGKVALGLGLVEGAIGWTYHGIRKVFTNSAQRLFGWFFLGGLLFVVLTNLYTERMLSRGAQINEFQQAWVDWAFDSVVGVMLAVGAIQLFSDDARLERSRLRQIGEQAEVEIEKQQQQIFPASIEASEAGSLPEQPLGNGYRR